MRCPCPDPEALGAYAEGTLAPAALQALEDHLADCPACRRAAVVLARRPGAPAWRWGAAAAAVLLLVAWASRSPEQPAQIPAAVPGPFPVPRPPAPAAGEVLEAASSPRTWGLPGGARIALDAGGLAALDEGGIRLERGTLWVQASSSFRIRTALGEVLLDGAECLVFLEKPPSAARLLREALAETDGLQVVSLKGKAVLVQGAERREIQAIQGAAAPAWLESLRETRLLPGNLLEDRGRLPFPDPGDGDYALEVLLKAKRPEGDIGIAFPAGGIFPCWVVSAGSLGEAPCRLEVRRQGDLILFIRDGRQVSRTTVGRAKAIEPWSEGPGILSWGASVEVAEMKVTSWR